MSSRSASTISGRGTGREVWLALLLVASGAAALMHQAAWFRLLRPVLGVGVLPAAAVSAGALLGLAIGSVLGGRFADLRGRPGRVFVVAEAGAALLGFLLVPGLAAWVASGGGLGSAADVVRLAAAVFACAATALPMGATLPAAVRAAEPDPESVGASFRRLYGWNTLGAVAGVLLAAGWLLEAHGNLGVVRIASGVQLGVAVLALVTLGRLATPEVAGTAPPAGAPTVLRAAAFLAGGAGLAVQVAWVRRLTPVVGNTTYAFATVLATYLLALALGTLLLGPRRGRGPTRGPAIVLLLAAIPTALLPGLVAWVGEMTARQLGASEPTAMSLLLMRTAAAGVLLVPSTILGAAALPWLVRAAAPPTEASGRETGGLLGWNTAGSALFAVVTGFVWLPAVGSAAVLRGAAGTYLLAAALVAPRRAVALGALALGLLLVVQPAIAPMTDDALFDVVGATFAPDRFGLEDAPRTFAEEGRAATVVVRDREGLPELWVDSKIVASTGPTDRLHLSLLGHLPMLLHPDPKRVAVVGLGTGITSSAAGRWAPDQLDVFELEPAVVRAAERFADEGGGVPADATLRFGDGRHHLALSGERYDVITSDPIHPAVAGSASLYSAENYELLRARGDLVCQWLPLYQMRIDDVRLVIRTFASVFPEAYVFLAGPDAILVGADAPLAVDEARLRERLGLPAAAPLDTFGLRSPGALLGLVVQGPTEARAFASTGPLNTDDRLLLEFRCARSWFVDETAKNARYLRIGRIDPATLLADTPSDAFADELETADRFRTMLRVWLEWQDERAVGELEAFLEREPQSTFAQRMLHESLITLADAEISAERYDDAVARLEALLDRDDVVDRVRLDAIELLLDAGRVADARRRAREIADRRGWPRAVRLAGG